MKIGLALGGVVNLLPYDHLLDRVDITIAVNISRTRAQDTKVVPNAIESVHLKFTSNKRTINNTAKGAVVIFPKSGVQLISHPLGVQK